VQLEKQVKQVVADLANPQTSARPASSGSGMPSGNGMVGKLRAQTAGVKKDYNEWTILDAYNAIEAEEGAQATYKKAKSKQRQFKTLLDKQVQECSGKGSNEKDEEKQYVAKQNYLLEEWKTGQQKVQLTIRGKLEEEKRAREGQISERQQRKKTELAARRAAEIQELDIVRQEIQRQEQVAIDKKIKEKERLKGIRLENEMERLVRKKRAEEEATEDQRLMEEYKRKLEQEEVDRANAFKRRLDKLEATGSKWAEEGAGKEQMDVEKRLEAMVLREAAKKDAADEERERRDKAALKYNAKLMAETNKSLMASKVRAGTAQQTEEKKYAQQFRSAGEDYQREEINRKIAKRKAMQAHQAQLMEQVGTHTNDAGPSRAENRAEPSPATNRACPNAGHRHSDTLTRAIPSQAIARY